MRRLWSLKDAIIVRIIHDDYINFQLGLLSIRNVPITFSNNIEEPNLQIFARILSTKLKRLETPTSTLLKHEAWKSSTWKKNSPVREHKSGFNGKGKKGLGKMEHTLSLSGKK